jgi:hypothetical protein
MLSFPTKTTGEDHWFFAITIASAKSSRLREFSWCQPEIRG